MSECPKCGDGLILNLTEMKGKCWSCGVRKQIGYQEYSEKITLHLYNF